MLLSHRDISKRRETERQQGEPSLQAVDNQQIRAGLKDVIAVIARIT